MSSGDGANGGVIITYTNSGAQVITKFAVETSATYTIPSGSTDLVVYAVGGGGGGGWNASGYSGAGGGGGVSKSNTFAEAAGRVITYTVGDGGQSVVAGDGAAGGTTSVTIGTYGAFNDLTLQSSDTTAEAVPTNADMVILVEDAGSGVGAVQTHIKGWISRYETGGTKTWTQGTLVDEGDWGTDKRILAFHDLDISAQASGTQMAYKITTHSASAVYDTKIHATSIGWK
jgi:hypothetical protein